MIKLPEFPTRDDIAALLAKLDVPDRIRHGRLERIRRSERVCDEGGLILTLNDDVIAISAEGVNGGHPFGWANLNGAAEIAVDRVITKRGVHSRVQHIGVFECTATAITEVIAHAHLAWRRLLPVSTLVRTTGSIAEAIANTDSA
jgi:hypothetical protein